MQNGGVSPNDRKYWILKYIFPAMGQTTYRKIEKEREFVLWLFILRKARQKKI